jgi:hypothetical protein
MITHGTQNLINYKIEAMKANSYSPELHSDKKILTLMACHSDRILKKYTIVNNVNKINFKNNDIVIINSDNTGFGSAVREETAGIVKDYIEIPNDINKLDIGKYMVGLRMHNYLNYDFVVFINDSIILDKPINHFYNIMIKKNVDLYGINSSASVKYHYQSYLYGIKSSAVINLIKLYNIKKPLLTSGYWGVVTNIELELCYYFKNKDCFLDFATFPEIIKNGGQIFLDKSIYKYLLDNSVFSLIKVKTVKNNTFSFHQ